MMKSIYIIISFILFCFPLYGQAKITESISHPAELNIFSENVVIDSLKHLTKNTPESLFSSFLKKARTSNFEDFQKYYVQNDEFEKMPSWYKPQEQNFIPVFRLTLVWNGQNRAFIRGTINGEPSVYIFAQDHEGWKILLTDNTAMQETYYFLRNIKPKVFYSLLQGNLNHNPLENEIIDIITDQNGYLNLTSLFSLGYNTWHRNEGKKYGYYFFGTPLD